MLTDIRDEVSALELALSDAGRLVATIRPEDFAAPTPCEGWLVRDLIGHLIGQNHGFAEAIAAGDAERSAYAPVRLPDDDSIRAWQDSVDQLRHSIAGALRGDASERLIRLAELDPDRALAPAMVLGIQLVDTTVHSWDLAEGLGTTYRPSDQLVTRIARIAEQIPDDANRRVPGAAFAPTLATADPDPWITALARLGRAPYSTS